MLNYGAAAQEYFGYNESDLANSILTEEQQALATGDVTANNNFQIGENGMTYIVLYKKIDKISSFFLCCGATF